jgi:hypothetical protein
MNEFELLEDDYYAIELAKAVARLFLKESSIKPLQIISLGNALIALERLPLITPESTIEYGVCYRAGTDDFSEMRYIDFRISDEVFEISIGGSRFEKPIGSDSFSEPGWAIEVGGYRNTECDLTVIEDSIMEFLNLGAEIHVSDEF